jgi:5'-phosphate synthase pdxT subunit
LGFLDATVVRNAYGRQVDSFQARLDAPALGEPLEAIFIRAPRLRGLGPAVEVLARLGEEPVLVRQGRVLAATFHPELTRSRRLHRLFVELAAARATPTLKPTALVR